MKTHYGRSSLHLPGGDPGEYGMTKDKVKGANERYHNLKGSCDGLMSDLRRAQDRQKDFDDSLQKMLNWMGSAEEQVLVFLSRSYTIQYFTSYVNSICILSILIKRKLFTSQMFVFSPRG